MHLPESVFIKVAGLQLHQNFIILRAGFFPSHLRATVSGMHMMFSTVQLSRVVVILLKPFA